MLASHHKTTDADCECQPRPGSDHRWRGAAHRWCGIPTGTGHFCLGTKNWDESAFGTEVFQVFGKVKEEGGSWSAAGRCGLSTCENRGLRRWGISSGDSESVFFGSELNFFRPPFAIQGPRWRSSAHFFSLCGFRKTLLFAEDKAYIIHGAQRCTTSPAMRRTSAAC